MITKPLEDVTEAITDSWEDKKRHLRFVIHASLRFANTDFSPHWLAFLTALGYRAI
jgi:hypothetical protein